MEALDRGVYHIEPVQNPDGRDRHVTWVNGNRSLQLQADPLDREHNEGFPGGRTNHYLFDLNRDWLPLENPESQVKVDFHHRWRANVVTDYHEMGTNSTYYFEPSKPYGTWNPLIPPAALHRDHRGLRGLLQPASGRDRVALFHQGGSSTTPTRGMDPPIPSSWGDSR